MSLFNELKRRNVIRVAAAYLIIGWLLAQVSATLESALHMPEWFDTMIVTVMLIGFPIALIIAWVYELTPDGIKKEKDIKADDSITSHTGKKLDYITIVAALAVLGLFAWQQRSPQQMDFQMRGNDGIESETHIIPVKTGKQKDGPKTNNKSIAVLPFVNMSNDPSQEYFSDGMTEEILNVLAKNDQLLVAARTSAFSYKGKNIDIRTIGKELGVDHVLEGSVRRAGDELRITAQLIRVNDGFHLWSETYDRKLEKIFILQEEIAKDISKALAVPLGLKSDQLITNRTTDMAAYDLFLKGRGLIRKRGKSIGEAADLMEQVITRDPNYAPAVALYSIALNYIPGYLDSYRDKPLNLPELYAQSLKSARKAVRLDPTLAIAHYALANNYQRHLSWMLAEDEYLLALKIAPNNIDIIEDFAEFLQVVGRLKESLALAKKGYELEPNTPIALLNYADKLLYNNLRPDYSKIEKLTLKVQSIQPDSIWAVWMLYGMAVQQKKYKQAIDIFRNCKQCNSLPDFKAGLYYLDQLVRQSKPIVFKMPLIETLNLDIAYAVGGSESVLEYLEQVTFNDSSIYVQADFMQDIRKKKRFKTVVQYLGLANYWRLRHWPDFCHPISDTDFECD